MAAPVGLATWVTHGRIPPGSGFGSVTDSFEATIQAPGFVALTLVFAAIVGLGCALVFSWARARGVATADALPRVLAPLAWGMSLPVLAPLIDAAAFWCAAPPLAAIGIGYGGLASARRWKALGAGTRDHTDDDARSDGFGGPVDRRMVAALATAIPLLLLAAGWSPPTGDEPNYLVVAHSLVNDVDLDLSDDYRSRVYAPFHPAVLSPHYRPGLREGSRYSMHGVGLPLLIAPAYALGSSFGPAAAVALPRAVLAFLYGIFAWVLYGFIRDVSSARAACRGTLATTLFAPMLFTPMYLFPEVPAMLLSLTVFRGLRLPQVRGTRYGLLLAVLPFFGVKYLPLVGALLVVGVVAVPERRLGRLIRVGGPVALGLIAHAFFTWRLYGSLSPAAVYLGAGEQAGAPALGGDWGAYVAAWPAALATGAGFLLDQKEGLLAYGPHFLLAAAGVAWMWRRQRTLVLSLALVAAAYVGPYALSQQLGGQGPPVRPLMAVLWVLSPALGIALELRARSRWYAVSRGALLGLGGSLTVAYAAQPQLLPHDYPVVASRLIQNYSPHGSGWWRWFPQWVNIEEPNVGVTAVWALFTLVAVVALWRYGESAAVDATESSEENALSAPASRPGSAAAARGEWAPGRAAATAEPEAKPTIAAGGWRAAAATIVLAGGLVMLHHLSVVRTDRHRPTRMANGFVAWLADELPPVAYAEPGGIWATPGVPVDVVVTSAAELESMDVSLRVLVPAEVAVSVQGAATGGRATPGSSVVARLRPGRGRRDGDRYAYLVRLSADEGAVPADLLGGADERNLGAFLEVVGRVER